MTDIDEVEGAEFPDLEAAKDEAVHMGREAACSLHFLQGVVSPPDQHQFTSLFFQVFEEIVPA